MDYIQRKMQEAAIEGIKSLLFEFLSAYGLSLLLGLLAALVVWAALKKVAEKYSVLTLAGGLGLAFGALFLFPGLFDAPPAPTPPPPVKAAFKIPMPKFDLAAIGKSLDTMWKTVRDNLPEVDVRAALKQLVALVKSVLPRWPGDEEIAMRRAQDEARRKAEAYEAWKRQQAEAERQAQLAEMQRRAAIRARNEQAKMMMNQYMNQGWQQLQAERAMRDQAIRRQLQQSMSPPTTFPGPVIYRRPR